MSSRLESPTYLKPLLVAASIVFGIVLVYWLTPYYTTQIAWEVRKSLFWTVPLLLAIVLAVASLMTTDEFDGITLPSFLLGAGSVLSLLWMFGYGILYHGYQQDQVYAQSLHVTSDHVPEMSIRTPYSVAQAQSRTTLTNTPGADLLSDSTMFDPAQDDFTTLAKGRSLLGDYAAVAVQHFPLTGRSKGTQCDFSSQAQRAMGGWFTHNLGRLINETERGVNWSESDAYGLCKQDGTPLVVVPLKRQVGWIVVTEVPAGVALYDGHSGQVSIETDTSKVTGTVYPLSLAEKQRESSTATGSWMQWLRNQIGWKAAEGEVNTSNSSEFVLGYKDGGIAYATPLSNQGNSTGIAAISVMRASSSAENRLNPIEVHTLSPAWVSIDAIESRIKADYQDIPNWQTLHVQEIAPINGNRWIATLGNDQNTLYRVEGTGDLSQFPGASDPSTATCLFQGTDTQPRRCGTLALVGGNGIGGQYGPGVPGGNPVAPPTEATGTPSLSDMSDQQLADLLRHIADEINRRASVPKPGR